MFQISMDGTDFNLPSGSGSALGMHNPDPDNFFFFFFVTQFNDSKKSHDKGQRLTLYSCTRILQRGIFY
jgi:hypothetical protein